MRNVGAVILAAGGSSRFGQPKQLLRYRGETLIRRVVRAAEEADCEPIVVVVGKNADAIRQELSGTRASLIENGEWQRGIGSSIRCGVHQIAGSTDAAILLTCDQPLVDRNVIARLIAAQEESGKPIVASSYANTRGVPGLFLRSCFNALLALPDNLGAKKIIEEQAGDVASVTFEEGAIDIDTAEDFERLKRNRG
jgi:molybdenum cofactor cytidylyltransferase